MKAKIAITDERIDARCERGLALSGFKVIKLPPFSPLGEAVRSHVDTLLLPLGKELITYADYLEKEEYVFSLIWRFVKDLGMKISCVNDVVGDKYPADCHLNALRFGNKLFCKSDTASEYVVKRAKELGLEIVHTKQGYPACTVLKLTEDRCITADKGLARVLEENGVGVALIENGGISLPPHQYGFIGGCAGVFENKIYFLGDPSLHPSAEIIRRECAECGLQIVPLSDGILRDLGGILFPDACVDQNYG